MIRHSICLMLLLSQAACGAAGDPFVREGTWHMHGDNDANLQAMLLNPHDLVQGRGSDGSMGAEAAPPIKRLLSGKRYPLSTESASGITASSGATADPQAASPGGSNDQNQ